MLSSTRNLLSEMRTFIERNEAALQLRSFLKLTPTFLYTRLPDSTNDSTFSRSRRQMKSRVHLNSTQANGQFWASQVKCCRQQTSGLVEDGDLTQDTSCCQCTFRWLLRREYPFGRRQWSGRAEPSRVAQPLKRHLLLQSDGSKKKKKKQSG